MVQAGLSFEAIDTANGNERVGVFLCEIIRKDCPNRIDEEISKLPVEEGMQKMGDLIDYTKTFVDRIIFDEFKKSEYLEGQMVSVKESHGGRGIAKMLTEAILGLAMELKIDLVYVGCTSEYTAKAVAKLGFQEIFTMPYSDYKVNNEQVFHPKAPHTAFRGCIKLVGVE